MEICKGPRPGYCKRRDVNIDLNDCDIDDNCGRGTRKCCGAICVEPQPVPEGCYKHLKVSIQSSFRLIETLYEENDVLFCSIYTEVQEFIQVSLTVNVCPSEIISSVTNVLTSSLEMNTRPEPPKLCVEADVSVCFVAYNKEIDVINIAMSVKCSSYAVLETCAQLTLTRCDAANDEDSAIINSITTQLGQVKALLICSLIPEFELTVAQAKVTVIEGDLQGQTIGLSLKSNPDEACDGQKCEIKLTFDIVEPENKLPTCGKNGNKISQLLYGSDCDVTFTKDTWNVIQNVSLIARVDLKVHKDIQVTFRMSATLWVDNVSQQTVPVKDYKVVVKDMDTKSRCKSVNDPHLTTFDGYRFDNQQQGEFVLYKHTVYPFEVRVFYASCFKKGNKASCNCGVMVICGDDTFVIFKCRGRQDKVGARPTMYRNGELMKGFKVLKTKKRKFKVIFPHGTSVDIALEKRSKLPKTRVNKDFMNIYVNPSPADWGHTIGLCGTYDGDRTNDLLCPDGESIDIKTVPTSGKKKRNIPNNFSKCWQRDGVTDTGILQDNSIRELPSYCTFVDFVEQCGFKDGEDITSSIIAQPAVTEGRRKRATGDPFAGLDVDLNVIPPVFAFPVNGINETQAEETCVDAITRPDFAIACANLMPQEEIDDKVSGCIYDIWVAESLETDFLRTARESLRDDCSANAATSTNNTLISSIDDNACSNDCSGQGNCSNGTCTCTAGFVGEDCSLNIDDPPTVDQLDDVQCTSVLQDACVYVTVDGDDFVDSTHCHFETVQVTEAGIIKSGNQTSVPANVISVEEVRCNITSTGSLPLHAILVSVSNNNGPRTSQSEPLLFIAHDPICWSCTVNSTGQTASCTRERASCLMDGVCYRATDPKEGDPCYLCDAFTGEMVYFVSATCPAPTTTEDPGPVISKAREMNDSAVIGLAAGMAGLVLVVIGIVVAVFVIRQMNAKKSDRKSLNRRSGSSQSSEDNENFREVMYPAYPNYGYYGYGQDMHIEAPSQMFADRIPKRQDTRQSSSRDSDPTRHNDKENRHRSRHDRRDIEEA